MASTEIIDKRTLLKSFSLIEFQWNFIVHYRVSWTSHASHPIYGNNFLIHVLFFKLYSREKVVLQFLNFTRKLMRMKKLINNIRNWYVKNLLTYI